MKAATLFRESVRWPARTDTEVSTCWPDDSFHGVMASSSLLATEIAVYPVCSGAFVRLWLSMLSPSSPRSERIVRIAQMSVPSDALRKRAVKRAPAALWASAAGAAWSVSSVSARGSVQTVAG